MINLVLWLAYCHLRCSYPCLQLHTTVYAGVGSPIFMPCRLMSISDGHSGVLAGMHAKVVRQPFGAASAATADGPQLGAEPLQAKMYRVAWRVSTVQVPGLLIPSSVRVHMQLHHLSVLSVFTAQKRLCCLLHLGGQRSIMGLADRMGELSDGTWLSHAGSTARRGFGGGRRRTLVVDHNRRHGRSAFGHSVTSSHQNGRRRRLGHFRWRPEEPAVHAAAHARCVAR